MHKKPMLDLLASQTNDLLETFAFIGFLAIIISVIGLVCFIFYKLLFRKPKTSEEGLKTETVVTQSTEVQPQQEPTTQPSQDAPTTSSKSGMPWVSAIIVLIILAVIIFAIFKFAESTVNEDNEDGNLSLSSRSANIHDVEIVCNDFSIDNVTSLSIIYTITPNTDIENLKLKFSFADENKAIITTKTENLGDVDEGVDYTVKFSITDFTVSQLLEIEYSSYSVTGGTVSYFQ